MRNEKAMSLYEINIEIQLITEEILNTEDWTDQTALFDQLDDLELERDAKREAYVHVIRNAEATAGNLHREGQRFQLRAAQHRNLAHRLKERLQADLEENGEQRAIAGKWKIRRQKSPAKVTVHIDPTELPEEFQRVTVTVDKQLLLQALKQGTKIDGVEITQDEHLRMSLA